MKLMIVAAAALATAASAEASDFQGAWLDVRGGWDSVQLEVSLDDFNISESRSGFVYGGAGGYDFAIGSKIIAGIQVGAYGSTVRECSEVYGADEDCVKAGRDLEVLAKLGARVSDRTLLYGLAGYANGVATYTYEDFEGIMEDVRESESRGGFRIGAGVEQAVTEDGFLKIEYRYTSYARTDLRDLDIGLDADAGFNRHQILLGAGLRF